MGDMRSPVLAGRAVEDRARRLETHPPVADGGARGGCSDRSGMLADTLNVSSRGRAAYAGAPLNWGSAGRAEGMS